MKKIYLPLLLGVLLTGCGGGGTTTSKSSTTTSTATQTQSTIDPQDINLTKDIQEGKITDYDANDPIEVQYLSIVNYFRSLSIQCNDSHAAVGPAAPLEWNVLLADASKEHSDDMNASGVYDHHHYGSGTESDITGQTFTPARPSTPAERVARSGYAGQAGENIAIHVRYYTNSGGQPTNFTPIDSDTWLTIMEKWMTSTTGHCSNLMNHANKSFGMHETGSRVDDNGTHILHSTYWTQEFGNQ